MSVLEVDASRRAQVERAGAIVADGASAVRVLQALREERPVVHLALRQEGSARHHHGGTVPLRVHRAGSLAQHADHVEDRGAARGSGQRRPQIGSEGTVVAELRLLVEERDLGNLLLRAQSHRVEGVGVEPRGPGRRLDGPTRVGLADASVRGEDRADQRFAAGEERVVRRRLMPRADEAVQACPVDVGAPLVRDFV
jgi:hypothetical protein